MRRRLGRFEIPVANLYRSAFVNLNWFAADIAAAVPARRILEIGCGDGFLAQRLAIVYPLARYLGIDIAPTAGRLYRGRPEWATFRTMTVQELRAQRPEPFDLVLVADVIHHVAPDIRAEVLDCAAALVAPGGHLVVKEFERDRGLYYHLTWAADRFVSGDKGVRFMTLPELHEMLAGTRRYGFGAPVVSRVGPARNNVVFTLRRGVD